MTRVMASSLFHIKVMLSRVDWVALFATQYFWRPCVGLPNSRQTNLRHYPASAHKMNMMKRLMVVLPMTFFQ
jgi:hypothetical protein